MPVNTVRKFDPVDTLTPLTLPELRACTEVKDWPMVSLVLPTEVKGDTKQNPIRFKNLIRQAEEELLRLGMDHGEVERLFEKPRSLVGNQDFWENQAAGLAVYVSPSYYRLFPLMEAPEELSQVNSRFYIKPLIPSLAENRRFFLLALSQGRTDLYEGGPRFFKRVPVDFPPFQNESGDGPRIQRHTNSSRPGGNGTQVHGQGAGKDDNKEKVRRFLADVDKRVRVALRDDPAPLVLAAVDTLHPLYEKTNSHPRLVSRAVVGAPEDLTVNDLKDRGARAAGALVKEDEDRALRHAGDLDGTSRTSRGPREALKAAYEGRVQTLFIAKNAHLWGRVDEISGNTETREGRRPGDDDLLNLAALYTLRTGGDVYLVEKKSLEPSSPAAAVIRYP